MKGIVFTLDALFALMIAAAGITVILYFAYSAPTPQIIKYSTSTALVNEMASIKIDSLTGIGLAQAIVNQSLAYNQSWFEMFKDAQNSAGNPTGPSISSVAYTVNVPNQIMNGTIVAGYGNVYFGVGNAIYAINATTGNIIWTSYTPYNSIFYTSWHPSYYSPAVNATLIYDGMLIYTTTANTVALNAYNGSMIWSRDVPYQAGGSDIEPDGDEPLMHLVSSNGKIITGASDEGGDATTNPIYALFANNGTLAGSSVTVPPASYNDITSLAIYNGQIVSVVYTYSGNKFLGVELFTPIYNSTYAAAALWPATGTTGGSTMSNLAVYSNVIAVGEGNNGDLYSAASGAPPFSNPSLSSQVVGVSSYQGHFIFQASSRMAAYNSLGTQLWMQTTVTPSALFNSTPIQSSHNVYATWSNGWISEENLSTGSFTQNTQVPYSTSSGAGISINPEMILAYGKLFMSEGTNLVAFGTCQANSNSSILAALGTMYINNQGSCADYLLNSLQSTENSTFTVNNQSIITTSFYNGANSFTVIPYSSNLALKSQFSVSLWFSSNTPSSTAFDSELIDARQPNEHTFDLQLKGGANPGIYGDIGTGAGWLSSGFDYPISFTEDKWYNLVAVYSTTGWKLYLNGNGISGSYSGTPSLLGTDSNIQLGVGLGGSNPFKGSLANIQIYNTTLSADQAKQLYSDGIGAGPVLSSNTVAWFPLAGDANGYSSRQLFPGFDSYVSFVDTSYTAIGVQDSSAINSQSLPVVLFNYTTGKYGLYNVGVYSWK